tara:strand:- start:4398 stop:5087 length:690 start_codon:yes stop_codon:yes gene_type:complete
MGKKRIIVALDNNNNIDQLLKLVDLLKSEVFAFKIGYEFFFNFGLDGYKLIQEQNVKIFLDLKLHDIPNTVKKGIEAISKINPFFTTIHISGGDKMQNAAIFSKKNTKILGVSILTSLDDQQTLKYYFNKDLNKIVSNFTTYAIENNLDGVVCSPLEVKLVKKISGDKLIIVVPGIRPKDYKDINDDQKRFIEPKEAVDFGADFLVIGRPITKAKDPLKETKLINKSLF